MHAIILSGESAYVTVFSTRGEPLYAVPGETLKGVNFTGVDLTEADLKHRDLRCCDFTWCHLTNADLRGSLLEGAIFSHAQTIGTRLENSSMYGVSLRGTSLEKREGIYLVELRLAQLGIMSYERLRNKTFLDACLLYVTLPTEEEQLANIEEIL